MLRSPCFRYIPSDRSRRPGGVVDFRSMISATVVGTSRLPQSTFADHPESLYLVRIDRIIIQRSRASRCSTKFCFGGQLSRAIIMSRSSIFSQSRDPSLLLSTWSRCSGQDHTTLEHLRDSDLCLELVGVVCYEPSVLGRFELPNSESWYQ